MIRIIKVSFSILLLLCLFDMKYGYYNFVRVVAIFVFSILLIEAKNKILKTFYFTLLITFQPLIKIPFGRFIWNVVDVAVAAFLIISVTNIFEKINNNSEINIKN